MSACRGESAQVKSAPFLASIVNVMEELHEGSPGDQAFSRQELRRIATAVRERETRNPEASRVEVLSETLFGALGFVREVDDTDLKFVLLPSVLVERRGTCVGLGSLYLALAEELGLKAHGVMLPGHFYVEFEDGSRSRSVELLRKGEEMPNEWYRTRYPVEGVGAKAYGRALSNEEVLGVIAYDVGNERRREKRLVEARMAYEQAVRHFPGLPEAHASLGAVFHLLGALAEAKLAYEAAARIRADLPGLRANVARLEEERDAGRR